MLLQLRPGLLTAWRGPGRLQLGLDERAVVLDGLTAPEESLLDALDGTRDLAALLELAERRGVGRDRARELVRLLGDAGVLVPARTPRHRLADVPAPVRRRCSPDAAVLGLAHADGDGWHVLSARARAAVVVVGASRTGLAVAHGLAAAGVGAVLVEDAAAVAPGDVGPGGYGDDDVGRPRGERAAALVADRSPTTATSAPPSAGDLRPDLVVLVAGGAVDPWRTEALVREGVPHLPVLWRQASVAVGPLVRPGSSTCLRCVEVHRTDRDPQWPRLVAQLAGVPPGGAARPEEASLAALAASLACVQALAQLDGVPAGGSGRDPGGVPAARRGRGAAVVAPPALRLHLGRVRMARVSSIPRGPLGRGLRLATLPAAYAGRQALGLGRRAGGRTAEEVAAGVQAATAEQLFSVLGQLKGGAMKFGQALSVFEAALPEEVAGPYRATLTRLQDAAPPMPAATVHAVLADQLGPRWRERFTAFDDVPAAAASVGQVHRATWSDGREVAVKVQYPGAGQALVSDLDQLSRVVRLATGWLPGLDLRPVLTELKARIAEELDYRYEAEAQAAFAEAFAGDPRVAVPAVVHSADRVLVTEWLDGTPLAHVIAEGTQDERDLAATRYLELLLTGPERAGLLHADPHPGNFRITPDGRFGVLDFGAVDRLPGGMPPTIGRLMGAALDEDGDELLDGLRDEGFVKATADVDPDELLDYVLPFLEALHHEVFRFDRAWLQSLFRLVNDRTRPEWSVGLKVGLPPEYVLIHRVWLGGIGVLCQLGGDVRARDLLEEHLPGLVAP